MTNYSFHSLYKTSLKSVPHFQLLSALFQSLHTKHCIPFAHPGCLWIVRVQKWPQSWVNIGDSVLTRNIFWSEISCNNKASIHSNRDI